MSQTTWIDPEWSFTKRDSAGTYFGDDDKGNHIQINARYPHRWTIILSNPSLPIICGEAESVEHAKKKALAAIDKHYSKKKL